MSEIATAYVSILPSTKGFKSHLERGTTPGLLAAGNTGGIRFGDAAGKSAGKRFGSIFKTAAKASLIGLAGAGALAVKFGSDAVGSASELNESLNAVNVTYGKQAKAVQRLGRQSAKSLGLSNTEFNSLSVRFSAFTKTIAGGDGKKVVSTLDDLSTRASDFASVMNLEVNDAAQLFQSGLAGESEPLRKFGIDLSAASVEAFAYANGIAESGAKLTEAQKVQARYGSIMEQTAKTQGDFKNTSGELANQQRILSARWEDGKAKLGKGLLPIMSDAADFLLTKGIPAFEDFSDWFTKKGIPAFKHFADEQGPRVVAVFEGIKDFAKDAKPFVEGIVSAFDSMPGWIKKVLVGGAVGGLAAKRLGIGSLLGSTKGGGLGGGSGLLGLISKAKPIPVFVTNPGGIGAGGGKVPGVVPGGVPKVGLPKWAPFIPVGLGSAPGQDSPLQQLTGWSPFGVGKGDNMGGGDFDFTKVKKGLQGVQLEWDETRNRASDYFQLLQRNKNVKLLFTVNGIDLATQKARDYYATLLDIRALHFDFDTPTPGQPPNRSPGDDGKGGGTAHPRGVYVHVEKVVAQDTRTILADLQQRKRRASSDGVGR